MQLASDTSSADGNCPFPTFLLLSLTHLTLVCLKHCTRRSFSCSEQKPRSEDLFVEVVELLCAVPQMILEILSHLVAVLSGTKLSEFGTRPSLLAPLDARFSARRRRKRVGKRFAGGLALIIIGAKPPPDLSPARVTQGLMLDCSEEALECAMEC